MNEKNRKDGSFILGVGLIGAGLVDAAFNPFAFITAPKLIFSGIAMVGISVGKKPEGKNYE